MLSGRALAVAVLGWALVRSVAKRVFGAESGLRLFHANYDEDRLPPVDAATRRRMATFSRCIACGRCDVGEAERIAASRGAYPGLMRLVLASSRSMPDYDAAALALEHVPESVLREKERVCPTGVPFVELARFVARKATEIRRAPPEGGSRPTGQVRRARALPMAPG